LIQKANNLPEHLAHKYVHSVLFTNVATKRLINEIAPRFKEINLNAGFTKVTSLGQRDGDSAKMAMIEIIGNQMQ
jgi:ribosomal protein L17